MTPFHVRDGALWADDVALAEIADAVGTPFYCYSQTAIEQAYRAFADAFARYPALGDPLICYSVKANGALAVVAALATQGAGADVVSEGELRRALAAGVPARKIVFSGVGKTAREMAYALDVGIHQFNVESEPELEALSEVAAARGVKAPVAIRVNPDVAPDTHAKIATGGGETKFGVAWGRARQVYARAAALPGIAVVGIDVHIGSQIVALGAFEAAFAKVAELARALHADGHAIDRLDLGGGLGIAYEGGAMPPDVRHYAAIVERTVGALGCELIFEPGRALVGAAGALVARVVYVKRGEDRTFVILDAAMNDLIRPTLYDAHHEIVPVRAPAAGAILAPVDVVGPVCETGDVFALERPMPPLAAGDLVAILSAGAYGAAMASNYNSRPLAAEVMVIGDRFAVVRPRQTYEAILAGETVPDWHAAIPAIRKATG